ncbi:MAG: radical SAM protein [Candidatus Tectomicrobia bacterium]|uniref:Radical SAM protein n=1 Tax=Tectimicrobiota bacterium TaxID=2528274 RepID=A0A933GMA4_UNCTE|nr:radical SAM protein [Candidatus Tectomicrobia bacterium]
MDILLVAVNRSREIMPCMPVGIACLLPLLKKHTVKVMDLFWESQPEEALRKTIQQSQPHLVGFSIRNIDNQLWSRPEYYLPQVKRYIEVVKKEAPIPVVVGGAGYSIFPHAALDYVGADWGIAGDGELSFPQLLETIESDGNPAGIPGLIAPGTAGRRSALARIKDYGQIPLPEWNVLRVQDYLEQKGSLSLLSKRGCSYNCLYCDVPAREGYQARGKNPQRLVDEMELAFHMGVAEVFIADNIFNYPQDYARAVAEEILRRNIKIKWSATLHPLGIDGEDMRILRRSGLRFASLGPDTGSPEMLKRLQKGFSLEEVWHLIGLLKENGIGFFLSILLGGPGETHSTVEESLRFASKAEAAFTTFRLGIRITPLTGLSQIALQEGVLKPTDNLMIPHFYMNKNIQDWVGDYLRANFSGNPRVLIQ